jgi:hypothetical protein
MYWNIYHTMTTITLYDCDLCYLVQDSFKIIGGGEGSGPPSPHPRSVRHRLAETVNSAFKFEVNVCSINFTHGYWYILFLFL